MESEIKFIDVKDLVKEGIVTCATTGITHEKDPKTGRTVIAKGPLMTNDELSEVLEKTYSIVCAVEVPISIAGEEGKAYFFVTNQKGRARVGCMNARGINAGTTHKFAAVWWRSYNMGTRTDRIMANLGFSHMLLPNSVLELCYQHAAAQYGLAGGISEASLNEDPDAM